MVVRKLTNGAEAERIIDELCRLMEWHYGIEVNRDSTTLSLPDADPGTVRIVLDGISDDWRTHVTVIPRNG
jgi:hypothetical protein